MQTPRSGTPHPLGHDHVADLDACLALINSIEYTDGVPEDHLPGIPEVVGFLASRGLAHAEALEAQAAAVPAAWLARVDAARVALRRAWDATVEGTTPPADAIETLNDALARAPAHELRAGLAGVAVGHRHDAHDPLGEALARVTMPFVETVASGHTGRFRICANDGCRWVFEDTSRGGRRRWCDMNTCGNRAKVRRFRSRRAAGPPPGTTTSRKESSD